MQSLNTSIPRGKPFVPRGEMPKGSGLPLCLSGVCIMSRVPDQRATLCSTSSRCSGLCRGSSPTLNFGDHATLNLNATESCGAACYTEDISRENSADLHSGSCELEANVHRRRNTIARRMVELDLLRESLRKRRLVQGLGSFLEEQAFMLLRQSRFPQEGNRSLWQELIYAELYASDSSRLGHCGARAA